MDHTEPHPVTPRLTQHARERCEEMGISTKVAKRIWQHRSIVRPMHDQHKVVVTSTIEPDYVLIVDATTWLSDGEVPVIITVMFSCRETYAREGQTYRVLDSA